MRGLGGGGADDEEAARGVVCGELFAFVRVCFIFLGALRSGGGHERVHRGIHVAFPLRSVKWLVLAFHGNEHMGVLGVVQNERSSASEARVGA